MALFQCPECGKEISDKATNCPGCGNPIKLVNLVKPIPKNLIVGNSISLLGGLFLLMGLYLPWASLGIINVSAFKKTEDAEYILIIAIIVALLSLIALIIKKSFGLVISLIGIGSIAYLYYIHDLLKENLGEAKVFGKTAQIGSGFWLCCLAAGLIFLGAIITVELKKKK